MMNNVPNSLEEAANCFLTLESQEEMATDEQIIHDYKLLNVFEKEKNTR